jgi:hypothetical protein
VRYYGAFDIVGFDCTGATYTIYAVDLATGLANGTVLPASGVYTGGLIQFSYNPFPGATDVRFRIVINCEGKKCLSKDIDMPLKHSDCREMKPCDIKAEWKYFRCFGKSDPYFGAYVSVNNTTGCNPSLYSIIAVDPITGLPNGTIAPATGSLSMGWSDILFKYYPDPGVTAVRFLMVVSCKDRICYIELGKFEKLEKYPCKEKELSRMTSGIGETKILSAQMQIAPNPANSNVNISFTIPEWKQGDVYKIHILNLPGQSVAEYNAGTAQGSWQYATLQLSSGT